jgi:hypothetical protein
VFKHDGTGARGASSSEELPLADVAEMRLRFAPSRYRANRYECRMKWKDGRKISFTNDPYRIGEAVADPSREYRTFVADLAREVGRATREAKFERGLAPTEYVIERLITWLIFAFVTVGVFFFGTWAGWMGIVKLPILLSLIPLATLWMRRSVPGGFDPYRVPEVMLPDPS